MSKALPTSSRFLIRRSTRSRPNAARIPNMRLSTNAKMAFCFGFGAVLNLPTSLRLPRFPTKRNQ